VPTRIEINVVTGESKVLELTPEELADVQVRIIAEAARVAATPPRKDIIDSILALPPQRLAVLKIELNKP